MGGEQRDSWHFYGNKQAKRVVLLEWYIRWERKQRSTGLPVRCLWAEQTATALKQRNLYLTKQVLTKYICNLHTCLLSCLLGQTHLILRCKEKMKGVHNNTIWQNTNTSLSNTPRKTQYFVKQLAKIKPLWFAMMRNLNIRFRLRQEDFCWGEVPGTEITNFWSECQEICRLICGVPASCHSGDRGFDPSGLLAVKRRSDAHPRIAGLWPHPCTSWRLGTSK